ncbi:hypothetical protein GJ496_010444 [Pomphorhynchus laevis]|nr:hypothetical protein GJ496_010444 [Pomphorhynchus laevis]
MEPKDNSHQIDEPLQWMYNGDKPDAEEFLLGKRIDNQTQIQRLVADDVPGSYTVDMANKIREDPLFIMKKHELEETKKLLENPLRMKKLKELLDYEQNELIRLTPLRKSNEIQTPSYHNNDRYRCHRPRRSRSRLIYRDYNSRERSGRNRYRSRSDHCNTPRTDKSKYTNQQTEMRLNEMLKNGQWREKQREINVHKSKKRIEIKERKDKLAIRDGFMSTKHMSYSSLEDNIKRNPQRYRNIED